MKQYIKARREEGFTLIELLIAIVVVGILTAVVIVGIGGLNNSGSKSACQASADAAKAASAIYYANNSNQWPADLKVMVDGGQLDKPASVTYGTGNLSFVSGGTPTWTMTMTPGTPPTFGGC